MKQVILCEISRSQISEKNFIAIILNSLPPSWDLVIANVFKHKLLSVVIAKL